MKSPILNGMSVDVEEHFHVSAFEGVVDRASWDEQPSRVVQNTQRLLRLFDEADVKATFFVLGWTAERHPGLVREIADAGHELASHGYSHRLIYTQTPDDFREETRKGKQIVEDAAGGAVTGYRAASFSITRRNLWALDILAELGFEYDSSLFPVHHDNYGVPGMPRSIYRLRTPSGATLIEMPPATVRWAGMVLPAGGGGYLRILPAAYTRWALRRVEKRDGMPAVVYLHPWEVDPQQPRIEGAPLKSRLRHYTGLHKMEPRLADLMRRHTFGTMREVLRRHGDGLSEYPVVDGAAEPAVATAAAG